MPNVPNTSTFTLQDVYDSVHGHQSATSTNLSSCFTYAVSSYFDANYNTDSYAVANSMLRFRNYTPSAASPAVISMSLTYDSNPSVGVYNFTGSITVVASEAVSGSFGFALDFLSGSVPSGQSERRSSTVILNTLHSYSQTGAGSFGDATYSSSFSAGTTTISVNLSFVNDNWNDPRPESSFRLRLIAGTNTVLSTPNSTVINDTTYVYTVQGVTTTFVTITSNIGDFFPNHSGQMICYYCVRNTLTLGKTYSAAAGYKSIQIQETWNTGSYNANRFFVQALLSGSGPCTNSIVSTQYTHGTTAQTTIDISINAWFNRYILFNRSGSTATYGYTLQPYLYCSFTTQSYSDSILSFTPSGHVLMIQNYSGNNDLLPLNLIVFPGSSTLGSSDTFSYKYVAHCPTGGFINMYNTTSSTSDAQLYDGDSYQMWHDSRVTTFGFISVGNTSAAARTTLGLDGWADSTIRTQYSSTDQYLELVPTTSNVVTNSMAAYMIGYNGIIPV